MTSRSRNIRRVLVRAFAVPLVLLVAVAAYVVASRAVAVDDAGEHIAGTAPMEKPWKAGYSRRFPGCVAAVLWPGRDTPAAVVLQWRDGRVERVRRGAELRNALRAERADDARIIGACYR